MLFGFTFRVLVLPVAATLAIGVATAQSCGVRNGFRIVNSHTGVGSELVVDTGWQTVAPLITPGANSNPSATCSSQGNCTPTSDYGYLRCVGSGTANNCPASGVFLWLDQEPQARFFDTMTVVSGTLPSGAPVQVRVALTLDGHAIMNDPSPAVSYGVNLYVHTAGLSILDAPGTSVATFQTTVGASHIVQCNLGATLRGYGQLGLGIPPISVSYSVDLTARAGFSSLTPEASLTFCSGRTYGAITPTVAVAGGGCGAGSPVLSATVPTLGQTQTYTVTSSIPNAPVFFAYSLGSPVATPFGPCTVVVDLAGATSWFVGATSGAGACSFGLYLPPAVGLVGVRLTTQALVAASGGPMLGAGHLSNGLEIVLGP